MKVVVAIDSLKGSLTSMEAGLAIKEGIQRANKDVEVVVKPLADGGEGTTDALIEGLKASKIEVKVIDPLGRKRKAYYGYLKNTNTAVMEMAMASGITLINHDELNPMISTTYGVGMMIKDAIKRGIRDFIIGIGGSATNDGGIGMLQALGFDMLDIDGNQVAYGGNGLITIDSIKMDHVMKELKECCFRIACDVKNPLYGENGATAIFGAQKGVTSNIKETLDQAMKHYAMITKEKIGRDNSFIEGSGAAGGLGFSFISYLNGELVSGISLVLDIIGLEDEIKQADYVVTGEGCLDFQTAMGKAPIGVAKLAKKYNKKVIAFAGSITKDANICNQEGIDAFFPIVRGVTTLEDAMNNKKAKENMIDTVEQVFRLIV